MKNIIAVFNKNANKRILLCAHWDSRFTADNDTKDIEKPILGANDGGSGVGVLLEIARQLSLSPIPIGVDIIFFDIEDQGQPNGEDYQAAHSWCLGSQYWSNNPHIEDYFADFGILLDMVAGENAKFTKEGVSRQFASRIVDEIWSIAGSIGFANFLDSNVEATLEKHKNLKNFRGIRQILNFDKNNKELSHAEIDFLKEILLNK